MRRVFGYLPAVLVFSAFGALPAEADFADEVRKMGDPYRAAQASAPRQRVAKATSLADERTYDARPSLTAEDDDDEPRVTQRRRSKAARAPKARKRVVRHSREQPVRQASQRSRQVARHGSTRRTRVVALPSRQVHDVASYYHMGHTTASGARYNPDGLSAAHRTLPFGTRVRVTNLRNGRSVNVVINDRGPFIAGRTIDLSRGAARVIGMIGQGVARVGVTILGR